MADELQVVLKARDEMTRDLTRATKQVAKLEAAIQEATTSGSPQAQRQIERLSRELADAQDKAKTLSRATDQLDRKVDTLGGSASGTGRDFRRMSRDIDSASRKSKGIGASFAKVSGAFAAATGAVVATAGAFRFLADSVNEARTARKAVAQTAAVMRSMGRTEAPKAVDNMIGRLETLSGIDGDNLREMTNVLFTFGNVTGDTFEKANELALDVSVAFGKDLTSSAVMVGKALNDPAKGLTALSRIGVQFTAQQTEQVKAMMAANDIAGAQAIIMAELTRQVGGSAAAQADQIALTQVAWDNFKEEIGNVLLDTAGIITATSDMDPAKGLRRAGRWIRQNSPQIKEALLTIAGATARIGQMAMQAAAMQLDAYAVMMKQMAAFLFILDDIGIPKTGQWAESLMNSANSASTAAGAMRDAADDVGEFADKTFTARDRVKELNKALEKVENKKVRLKITATMEDVWAAVDAAVEFANNPTGRGRGNRGNRNRDDGSGDTAVGMGVGSLGAAGLQAAHAMYSGALGGHSITSGVRNYNLGSVQSDHRYGRAMDVQGPRLGAYAQVVRRNGGYAALHGTGGNRHLHVVPQTRRPQPRGGNSFHADVTVVNPAAAMDVEAAVARGLRAAARQTRERT